MTNTKKALKLIKKLKASEKKRSFYIKRLSNVIIKLENEDAFHTRNSSLSEEFDKLNFLIDVNRDIIKNLKKDIIKLLGGNND